MPGPKKDRKNGKEGAGGVVAAVTKRGAKFTNGNVGKELFRSPSSSELRSPEVNAATITNHDIQAPSPVLDAVSTGSYATSNNSHNTREWAKGGVAAMAGSPGNLISLVGESPPTAPSSYEDPRGGMTSGWSSPRPAASSASPPTAGRRPSSVQIDGRYSPPDVLGATANGAPCRMSAYAQYPKPRATSNPPLPHEVQPHFYGAPALDFDLSERATMKAGTSGYYFGYDLWPAANADGLSTRDLSVALAGYEGGLKIYSVTKKGLERRANLKGLRGGVLHARILPWTVVGANLSPLVAVVIHGPRLPAPVSTLGMDGGDYDAVSAERSDSMVAHGLSDEGMKNEMGGRLGADFISSFQTSVEVYSLRTNSQVAVLLEALPIPLRNPITSPNFKAPAPSGAFHIRAEGGYLTVSSGITGECWLYRHFCSSQEDGVQFSALGKIWTTLQQPLLGESTQEPERGRPFLPPLAPRLQSAILSMTDRWIAYCPATPNSQIAIRATVPLALHGRGPGLSTKTPPHLPTVSAEVEVPLSESATNKLMRDATQGAIQGAKWVGKQSWRLVNTYFSKDQPAQAFRSPDVASSPWTNLETPHFPPTHGTLTAPPPPKEPGLVAILDLEMVGSSASLHPLTTFAVPQGCSFLSFPPTGLFLFTVSSKGDVQMVWDLMRIQNTKSSPLQVNGSTATSSGPRVRQVAQFSRYTVARVLDVAWARPNGERFAMITERSAHIQDMPSAVFAWPPPRRRISQQESAKSPSEGASSSAVAMASSAFSSVRDVALPLIPRQRRGSCVAQQSGSGISGYAIQGGKVLVSSISHSLGKTGGQVLNQMRPSGNKISLPSSSSVPGPSCAMWITGRKGPSFYVLGEGVVRIFSAKSGSPDAVNTRQGVLRFGRYKEFRFPNLPNDNVARAVKALLDPEEYLDIADRDSDSDNKGTLVHETKRRSLQYADDTESAIPQAEIESSASYQPFHTDQRVALAESLDERHPMQPQLPLPTASTLLAVRTLNDIAMSPQPSRHKKIKFAPTFTSQDASSGDDLFKADSQQFGTPWAFGQDVDAVELELGLPPVPDEELFSGSVLGESRALPPAAMERVLVRTADDDQIVITTRRRGGAGGRSRDREDDGFFEDDCEVLDFADQRV